MSSQGNPLSGLAIVHIPKCAGTSLRFSLVGPDAYVGPKHFDWRHRAWVPARRTRNGFSEAQHAEFASWCDLEQPVASGLVMGHFAVQNLVRAGVDRLILTVREPRARLVSTFGFWKQYGDRLADGWGIWGRAAAAATSGTFTDFPRHPPIWPATQNRMAREVLETRYTSWRWPRRPPSSAFRLMRANYARIAPWSLAPTGRTRQVSCWAG